MKLVLVWFAILMLTFAGLVTSETFMEPIAELAWGTFLPMFYRLSFFLVVTMLWFLGDLIRPAWIEIELFEGYYGLFSMIRSSEGISSLL